MTYKFSKGHVMNDQNASATQVQHGMPRVAARNSKLSRITRSLLASLGLTAFVLVSAPALAATAPPLGVAQQFGVLGSASVTAAGTAVVNGDVGSSPTPTITGAGLSTVPPFTIHLANDAIVQQAQIDATAASTNLGLQGPGVVINDNLATVGVLLPGSYSFTSGTADLPTGATLTLNDPSPDNSGIFVFNVASSLTANVTSNVIGTANPCNIYWRVGSDATLNGLNFPGTVIAGAEGAGSVTVGTGANLTGRAMSLTASVTMPGTGQTIGGCSLNAPLVIGAVAPTVAKSFNPTTITAGGTSTLTITLSNTSIDTPYTITSLTDNLSGMLIANPTNATTTDCGGTVNAVAGGSTVTLTGSTIPMASLATNTLGTCTVTVDVTAATAGSYPNTATLDDTYTANATLTVLPPAHASIPTLSEWAMIMLVALLAMTGFVAMRRQV